MLTMGESDGEKVDERDGFDQEMEEVRPEGSEGSLGVGPNIHIDVVTQSPDNVGREDLDPGEPRDGLGVSNMSPFHVLDREVEGETWVPETLQTQ